MASELGDRSPQYGPQSRRCFARHCQQRTTGPGARRPADRLRVRRASCTAPTTAPWARSATSTTSTTTGASAPGFWRRRPRCSARSCCTAPASSRSNGRCTSRRRFNWFGHIAGGFIFGIGMVFAGGCPSRNLARAGGGDLRSLLTLIVLGLVAYMTIAGLFAPVRAAVEQRDGIQPRRLRPGHRRPAERADGRRRAARSICVMAVLIGAAALALLLRRCIASAIRRCMSSRGSPSASRSLPAGR